MVHCGFLFIQSGGTLSSALFIPLDWFSVLGLAEFIKKLKDTFYKLHPYELPYKPRITSHEVRDNFEAFNPLPSSIKSISDTSASLLRELNSLRINTEQLKAREEKAVAEMKHFLQHNFGNVYDYDYYSGKMKTHHSMYFPFLFIGREPTTWPANNYGQISVLLRIFCKYSAHA